MIAHLFTVLTLKRSILTEKISRRGYHLSREYAVDPLEILSAGEVMRSKLVALPAAGSLEDLHGIHTAHGSRGAWRSSWPPAPATACRLSGDPVVAYTDEPLRVVVNRHGRDRLHAHAGKSTAARSANL